MQSFDERISGLDLSLFEGIPSQTTDGDRSSLLSIQAAVRNRLESYVYLEIGSYHGGSIQPHLMDSRCCRIYSIDKRPEKQGDERGAFSYSEGLTEVMIEKLKAVCPEQIDKIKTFDMDASELNPDEVKEKPDLFFIDGEHTDAAVVSDFNAIRPLIKKPCIVGFHDCQIVFRGIIDILDALEEDGVAFKAYSLPNFVFVIELNEFCLHQESVIQTLLVDNYKTYLPSMNSMYKHREFCNHLVPKLYIRAYKSLYRFYSKTLRPLLRRG